VPISRVDDDRPDNADAERRFTLNGYQVQFYQVEGRWLGQATKGRVGVGLFAGTLDDAELRLRNWIANAPAPP
jgi:hypothetical protein